MKWASKQPVWGGLPGATLPCLAIHGYIHLQKLGQLPHVLVHIIVYISIGKASSRPGLPRHRHHLYECEHIHVIEMKS